MQDIVQRGTKTQSELTPLQKYDVGGACEALLLHLGENGYNSLKYHEEGFLALWVPSECLLSESLGLTVPLKYHWNVLFGVNFM